MNEKLLDLA